MISNSELYIQMQEGRFDQRKTQQRYDQEIRYTRDMLKPVVVSQSELQGVLIAEGTEVSNNSNK